MAFEKSNNEDDTNATEMVAESVDPNATPGPWPFPGRSPALKGDENPQVAGLVQELTAEDGPDADKSAHFKPLEFDREAYAANPQQYLDKIRPGRVFYPRSRRAR